MKKNLLFVGGGVVLLAVALFFARHRIADFWYDFNKPEVPTAVAYERVKSDNANAYGSAPVAPVEGGMASSEHFVLDSSPQEAQKPVDKMTLAVKIPEEINLNVPWISQAPFANWDMPYQEACEEASMIMLDGFYKSRGSITPQQADEEIQKLVAYQNKTYGDYKDTDAEKTAKILRDYFGYKDVRVLPFSTSDQIKDVVGRGFPVIIPFSGKDLQNPNFRNGGPLYHMLVVKGFTKDGLFVTGDPGTRKGKDYVYTSQRIIEAAHDWNDGNVKEGKKVMIVVVE